LGLGGADVELEVLMKGISGKMSIVCSAYGCMVRDSILKVFSWRKISETKGEIFKRLDVSHAVGAPRNWHLLGQKVVML
jgi:hypothetical protein